MVIVHVEKIDKIMSFRVSPSQWGWYTNFQAFMVFVNKAEIAGNTQWAELFCILSTEYTSEN